MTPIQFVSPKYKYLCKALTVHMQVDLFRRVKSLIDLATPQDMKAMKHASSK